MITFTIDQPDRPFHRLWYNYVNLWFNEKRWILDVWLSLKIHSEATQCDTTRSVDLAKPCNTRNFKISLLTELFNESTPTPKRTNYLKSVSYTPRKIRCNDTSIDEQWGEKRCGACRAFCCQIACKFVVLIRHGLGTRRGLIHPTPPHRYISTKYNICKLRDVAFDFIGVWC